MHQFIGELEARAAVHDASKLIEPEKSRIDETRERLMQLDYGTPEYEETKRIWADHHYAHNDHHIEYYENGVEGMTLQALAELFCDNVAAVETHKEGDNIFTSIDILAKRYNIHPQLVSILKNTARAWNLTGE